MPIRPPSVVRVNADTSGGGHAAAAAVLGGTAGDGWGRAAAYDAYADGLHTYALWSLRDHDAAADAVYCAFVAADRNHTNLQQPEQIQPWLYAVLRHECRLRAAEPDPPTPASRRLRPRPDALDESSVAASLMQLEGNLRRAEFQSLAWAEAEGLTPAHREVLELSIRHGLDSRGLALVLGLRDGAAGLAPTHGFGLLADAWRELERSLAAAAVAASGRENCAQLAELTFGWSGRLDAALRAPLTEHVDRCSRCQHYLHTVIGTPSAPTILPFVAAPRALRDILLGELADLDAASDAGVDLVALGARSGGFGPEGFPTRVDASSQQGSGTAAAGAGRGPRRRQPAAGRAARPQRPASPGTARPQPVYKAPGAGPAGNAGGNGGGSSTVGFTATAAGTAILSGSAGTSTVGFTATAAGTAIIPDGGRGDGSSSPESGMRRQSSTTQPVNTVTVTTETAHGPRPRTPRPDDELFSARGSWAEKVLPPDAEAAAAPRRDAVDAAELWRPEPDSGFVQTPSGRFATRPPLTDAPSRPLYADAPSRPLYADAPPRPRTADVPPRPLRPPMADVPSRPPSTDTPTRPVGFGGDPSIATGPVFPRLSTFTASSSRPAGPGAKPTTTLTATALMSPASTASTTSPVTADAPTHLPRFAKPAGGAKPTSPPASGRPGTASVRPRHKARPMKQAVVSAMALGAIGAVAAAAAAMLGVSSSPHSNTAALDGAQSSQGLGSASTGSPSGGTGAGRLTVSVTTGSAGATTGGLLTGDTGLGLGLLPGSTASAAGTSGAAGSAASAAPTTASAGAFHVSVNQRSADPDSVQILLRNTGGSAMKWSAAPSVSWLTLSQSSGTLAAGQSLVVTATATGAAPSGQWAAQIVFSPGGIVVTLHGGIPASTGSGTGTDPTSPAPSGGGTGTTPSGSGSTTSASPSATPSSQSPTPTASASSGQPTAPAGGSTATSGSQSSTPAATDTASAPSSAPPARPQQGH
jgi:DNA-directed RNA polymerase specialized sigma24 family protein